MKHKTPRTAEAPVAQQAPKRTPRVAAVRRLDPSRPQRVWSLLLSPTIWSERK